MNTRSRRWLVAALVAALVAVLPAGSASGASRFLGQPRYFDATVLPDGRVLMTIQSGEFEVWDPATGERDQWGGIVNVATENGAIGTGGLMGVDVDATSGVVYAVYTSRRSNGLVVHTTRAYNLSGQYLGENPWGIPLLNYYKCCSHVGGGLAVADGYLWIATGDDSDLNSGTSTNLKGKVVRFPLASALTATPEIVAEGMRNPWKLGTDGTRVWAGDVGSSDLDDRTVTSNCALIDDPAWEEINQVSDGGDFGWRNNVYPLNDGDGTALYQYRHACTGSPQPTSTLIGFAVSDSTLFDGRIWFADFAGSWVASMAPDGTDVRYEETDLPYNPASLINHPNGTLYYMARTGQIEALATAGGGPTTTTTVPPSTTTTTIPGEAPIVELSELTLDVLNQQGQVDVTATDPDGGDVDVLVTVELGHDDSAVAGEALHHHPVVVASPDLPVVWSLDPDGHNTGSNIWWKITADVLDDEGARTVQTWVMSRDASGVVVEPGDGDSAPGTPVDPDPDPDPVDPIVVPAAAPDRPALEILPGDGRLDVSWATQQSATNHQFRYREQGSYWIWDAASPATMRAITGLVNGVPVEIGVRSFVAGSWKPWTIGEATPAAGATTTTAAPTTTTTAPVTTTTQASTTTTSGATTTTVPVTTTTSTGTTPVVVPAPTPRQPSLTIVPGSGSLSVSWSTAIPSNLHQFRWRPVGTFTWNWDDPSFSTSRVVTGLTTGSSYEIEVRSFNTGAWQAWTRGYADAG